MEIIIIIFCIILAIIWLLILPIGFFVLLAKYSSIKQQLIRLCEKGTISEKTFIQIFGNVPTNLKMPVTPIADLSKQNQEQPNSHEITTPLTDHSEQLPNEQSVRETLLAKSALPTPILSHFDLSEPSQVSDSACHAVSLDIPNVQESEQILYEIIRFAPSTELQCEPPKAIEFQNEIAESAAEQPQLITTKTTLEQPLTNTSPTAIERVNEKADKKEKTTETSRHLPIILGIGVVFLCTAGAAFVTSIWGSASNFIKLTSIASFSLIFYIAFALAHYLLHIPNSARAFYILGTAGAGITIVGAELLGILCADSSLATQLLIPTALMSFGMFIGYKIFHSRLFIVLCGALAYTFLTSLSAAIFSSGWMFSVIPAALAIITFFIATFFKSKLQPQNQIYLQGFLIVSVALAFISCLMVKTSFESITFLVISAGCYLALLHTAFKNYRLWLDISLIITISFIAYQLMQCVPPKDFPWRTIFMALMTASFVAVRICACRHRTLAKAEKCDNKKIAPYSHLFIGICQFIALIAIYTLTENFINHIDISDHHEIISNIECFSTLIPAFYFLVIGIRNPNTNITLNLLIALFGFAFSAVHILYHFTPSIPAEWIIYLSFVLSFIGLALIPTNRFIGKQSIRGHFVTGFLLVLSTIALCRLENEFHKLTELVPITSALAFMILESIRWKRQNHRWMMWITAIMIYIISTTIVVDIATQFKPLFNIKLDEEFIPSILTAMAIVPILAEHFLCAKRQNRPYSMLMVAAYSIFAAIQIFIILIDEEVFPTATSIIAIVTGLIGSWCISHREKKHTDVVMAISVFAGFVLLFKTIYDLIYDNAGDEIFKLPPYFIWIFGSLVTALIAFYDSHKVKGYTNLRAVWGISAIPLLLANHDVYHIAHVAGVLAISGNLLQYLRDKGHSDHDRTLITISIDIFAIALSIKLANLPASFPIPEMIRPELIVLIPVLSSYLLSKFTWHFRTPSHEVSFMLAAAALFILFVSPDEDILFHTIVITAISLLSIGFSIFKKLKRYLLLGCAFIIIIFFRQTSSFWINLRWWIYLAIVAVLLVTIAVVNEIMSRKGASILKEMQKSKLNQWKW